MKISVHLIFVISDRVSLILRVSNTYHFLSFPRLRSQTESRYVQTVPEGKCLCPDRPRRKVPISRLSCVHQTFVRSCPDFRAFFLVSRLCKFERTTPPSCVHLGLDISTFRLGPQPGFPIALSTIFYCVSESPPSIMIWQDKMLFTTKFLALNVLVSVLVPAPS